MTLFAIDKTDVLDDEEAARLAREGTLVAYLGARVVRAHATYEVEAKYALEGPGSAAELLAGLVDRWQRLDSVHVDRVAGGESVMHPRYLTSGSVEYSTFEYCGAPLVKIKEHAVRTVGRLPVMVSTETFLEGEAALDWTTGHEDALCFSLDKTRAKVYVLARRTHTVFSVAVTVCHAGQARQTQLEVEYFGSLKTPPESIDDIVGLVAETAATLVEGVTDALPTTETKLEFARKNSSKAAS